MSGVAGAPFTPAEAVAVILDIDRAAGADDALAARWRARTAAVRALVGGSDPA